MKGRQVLHDGQADTGGWHGPVEPCAMRHDLHPILRDAGVVIRLAALQESGLDPFKE
jgi:hypothetical protein